ncbi:MAG TPA: hypothetical protein VFA12_17210 [Stellaceae bacterium]|nr:hypothetical protein [Stellaceae bacterium]
MQPNRLIRIRLIRHDKMGLLAAISEDLHGLVVHGRSGGEIGDRLEGAIRELLEAQGDTVVNLRIEEDRRVADAGWQALPDFIANASLADGHRRRDA